MGYSVITTVLCAADSQDLTDLPTTKVELSIPSADTSDDAWLSQAITQVSRSIARHCKRVFAPEQLLDQFDIQQDPHPFQTPGGFAQLQLSRWPALELGSVKLQRAPATREAPPIEHELCEGRDFRLNRQTGELLRLNRFTGAGTLWEAEPISVTYIAGYEVIPEDLVEICLRLVTARFKAKDRDPTLIQQETPGIGVQRYWFGGAPGQKGPFPPDIAAALEDYRMPTLA